MDVILKLEAAGKGKVQVAFSSAMNLFHENPCHKASNCIRKTYRTGTQRMWRNNPLLFLYFVDRASRYNSC